MINGILLHSPRAYWIAQNKIEDDEPNQTQATLEAAVQVAARMEGNEELYSTIKLLFHNITRVNPNLPDAWKITLEKLEKQGWTAFLDSHRDIRFTQTKNE